MSGVAEIALDRPTRSLRPARLAAWTALLAMLLLAAGWLYIQWLLRQPTPLPPVASVDVWGHFFDRRPLTVVTTVGWLKLPVTVPRGQFLIDQTIWQRMHFEDWDRLPAEVRTAALDRLIDRYGSLAVDRHAWTAMNQDDWDRVPQPIRAMAFVGMLEYWVDYYDVGARFALNRRDVRQTVKAIAMSESWFDHRACGVNPDGSVDIGLGGASAFARRTLRRWYREGRVDFALTDEDYANPWLAARWLAFWFGVMLEEAGGDLPLAVRAYNWGIGRAAAGAGEDYLAAVERRRLRYFEGPSRSPTWRRLSTFRRLRMRLAVGGRVCMDPTPGQAVQPDGTGQRPRQPQHGVRPRGAGRPLAAPGGEGGRPRARIAAVRTGVARSLLSPDQRLASAPPLDRALPTTA